MASRATFIREKNHSLINALLKSRSDFISQTQDTVLPIIGQTMSAVENQEIRPTRYADFECAIKPRTHKRKACASANEPTLNPWSILCKKYSSKSSPVSINATSPRQFFGAFSAHPLRWQLNLQSVNKELVRFSSDHRKTNTKPITPTDHNRSKQRDKPIRIPINYLLLVQTAGKIRGSKKRLPLVSLLIGRKTGAGFLSQSVSFAMRGATQQKKFTFALNSLTK